MKIRFNLETAQQICAELAVEPKATNEREFDPWLDLGDYASGDLDAVAYVVQQQFPLEAADIGFHTVSAEMAAALIQLKTHTLCFTNLTELSAETAKVLWNFSPEWTILSFSLRSPLTLPTAQVLVAPESTLQDDEAYASLMLALDVPLLDSDVASTLATHSGELCLRLTHSSLTVASAKALAEHVGPSLFITTDARPCADAIAALTANQDKAFQISRRTTDTGDTIWNTTASDHLLAPGSARVDSGFAPCFRTLKLPE